jgi:hypothetical protein
MSKAVGQEPLGGADPTPRFDQQLWGAAMRSGHTLGAKIVGIC